MTVLKDRIRRLRKALDLTQREFAERIGMKSNTIATYEMGRAVPSDPAINNICKEFRVNEEWLRKGKGDMFIPVAIDGLEALAEQYPTLTHESLVFVKNLISMSEVKQKMIMRFLREVIDGLSDVVPDAPAPPVIHPQEIPQDRIEAEVADYRRELLQEKEAAEKSKATQKSKGA